MLLDHDAEIAAAKSSGLGWQFRGPQGPELGGPETWRGQKWRPGSQRWANSGGKDKAKYAPYYYKQQDPYYHPKDSTGAHCFFFFLNIRIFIPSGVDRL